MKLKLWKYNRTRRKETRIKETFGYKKRFHFSTFMLDKLFIFIRQLKKGIMDKRISFLTALSVFYPSLNVTNKLRF